jgi:hypothetical protein
MNLHSRLWVLLRYFPSDWESAEMRDCVNSSNKAVVLEQSGARLS